MPPVKLAVVGGGPAGMTAAASASERGAEVTLFEKGDRLGRKLGITGKGRCNLTNNCPPDEFLQSVPTNPRFLYSSLYAFPPAELMKWLKSLGVPLKTERGNRVFPASDKASDVVRALRREVESRCRVVYERVLEVTTENNKISGLRTNSAGYSFDCVIVAAGGMSYPKTGSDGDSFKLARGLGLELTPPAPALVPLETAENWCKAAMGLSLRNTGLRVIKAESGKAVYEDFGELLFTHFGVSGPMILSASSYLHDIQPGKYAISLDLKPALDIHALDARLLSDFAKYSNRDLDNALCDLLPSKLIPVIIKLSGIKPDRKINTITRSERAALAALFKGLTCTIKQKRPIAEAIVTSGGVKVSELNPRTMECRRIAGLYFAGEAIDVDAYTGGFNLQIAFCTGRAAGISAACG